MNRTHHLQAGAPTRTSPALHVIGVAVLATMSTGAALAQSDSYNYFGISGGHARGHLDEQRVTNAVTAPGVFTNYSLSRDPKDVGYRMFVGRQFNRYFGMELGYFNLGKQRFDNTSTPAGTLSAQVRNQGVNLDVVGTLPVTEKFSVLGRAGVTYARTRANFAGTGALVVTNPNPSERGANPKVGLGVQYAFSEGFIMRGEAERYRINDAVGGTGRVNLYSVSLVFPFGRAPAAAPRSAYVAPTPPPAPLLEPVMVVQAPPPAVVVLVPAPAPAPVVVPLRRVSYSAESMFGFDRSTVRPEGMTALDSFAAELAGTNYSNIMVEGHTDRLGTDSYNQTLSQQRAEAVKDYLVRSGLDPAKITALGKGEGTPATKTEDCKGRAANTALVACLQPDRRVEIEVSGTR